VTRNTLLWRRSRQPLLQLLRANEVPYLWGQPRTVLITTLGTTHCAETYQALEDILKKLRIDPPSTEERRSLSTIDLARIREFMPWTAPHRCCNLAGSQPSHEG
ncbi:Hypothetical predicted protein, partial [Pelobates cultripes]